jgi:hypothetical protein
MTKSRRKTPLCLPIESFCCAGGSLPGAPSKPSARSSKSNCRAAPSLDRPAGRDAIGSDVELRHLEGESFGEGDISAIMTQVTDSMYARV